VYSPEVNFVHSSEPPAYAVARTEIPSLNLLRPGHTRHKRVRVCVSRSVVRQHVVKYGTKSRRECGYVSRNILSINKSGITNHVENVCPKVRPPVAKAVLCVGGGGRGVNEPGRSKNNELVEGVAVLTRRTVIPCV